LRELMALVDKSLLHRASTPSASPSTSLRTGGRYEVHELLRQYAAEKLDQVPAVGEAARERHCAYYAVALQQWATDLKGPRQQEALAEIEADSENARAAWNWAVERGKVSQLDQAMEGLCRFYEWRVRYQVGEAACRLAAGKLAVTASGEGLRVLVKVLTWQSVFSRELGRTELTGQLLRQGLALLEGPELDDQDTRPERAFALEQMGHMAAGSDCEEARQLYEQSLALYQALGDRGRIADLLQVLSGIALHQGQLEEGERLARESFAIRQELGDRAGIASGLITLGVALLKLGKYVEAHSLLEESAAIYNDLGEHGGLALSLLHEAEVLLGRHE
jgi:tetratricopeptide (TPR) repeat protein